MFPFIKPFAARTYPKQVTASMGMDMRRYLLNGIFNEPNIHNSACTIHGRLCRNKAQPSKSIQ